MFDLSHTDAMDIEVSIALNLERFERVVFARVFQCKKHIFNKGAVFSFTRNLMLTGFSYIFNAKTQLYSTVHSLQLSRFMEL